MNTLEILKNKYVQLTGCLLLGITIGAVFYPTSNIEDKYKMEYQLKESELKSTHLAETKALSDKLDQEEASNKIYQEETSKKIHTLVTENSSLKSSIKKKKFKLIKPDGTIVEEEFEESNSEATTSKITEIREEFNKKVSEIETKWKKVHEERVVVLKKQFDEEIKRVREESKSEESSHTVSKNKKNLGIEYGMTTEKEYYSHTTYTLWGPIFIGGGISGVLSGPNRHFGDARFGLGINL